MLIGKLFEVHCAARPGPMKVVGQTMLAEHLHSTLVLDVQYSNHSSTNKEILYWDDCNIPIITKPMLNSAGVL